LKKTVIAVIAAHKQNAKQLRDALMQSGAVIVAAEVVGFCQSATDWSVRHIADAEPEIVLIDMSDPPAAMETPQIIQSVLPNARLFVTATTTNPQLMIELMRLGVREFLPSPLTQDALMQALDRYTEEKVRTTKQNQSRARRGKLFCVMSAKHGSGATTVAVNVAGIIAARSESQRTALIDLDRPCGDAAAYLNVKPNYTVTDALAAGPRLDSVLLESFMQTSNGFHVLPGYREHTGDAGLSAEKLDHLLEVAQLTFDHTIVDLPTALDEHQVSVIARRSSTTLVVLTPELPNIWRTERFLAYLNRLQASERVRIVLNRSMRTDEINDADIEDLLRMQLSFKLPNEYPACIKAINSGSLLDATNTKQLGKALAALVADITGLPEVENRRGLFGMLLKPSMGGTNA
jgi:pilus assembly protein CpaE